jgi:hypothetical protein
VLFRSVMEVKFDKLLGGSELRDKKTSVAVVASIDLGSGSVKLATVPDAILAQYPHTKIDVSPGEDSFMRPTDSRHRVVNLIATHPCEEITDEVVENNKLVGIKFEHGIWKDNGVFYNDKPTEEWKAAVQSVLGPAKKAGVHPIGRAALMLKVLFAVAGIRDKTSYPFFALVDAWKGKAPADTQALIEAVKSTGGLDKTMQEEIIKALQSNPSRKVEIRSAFLDEDRSPEAQAGAAAHMFPDISAIIETKRTYEDEDDDDGELPEDLNRASKIMFRKFYNIVIPSYKENFLRKFAQSAVYLGHRPYGWPNWKDGIHGIYSKVEKFTMRGNEYKSTPWAVADSFAHIVL